MSTAYTARNLTCRIAGRAIVANVDLSVQYGSVLALVGPNGAGKSTLLGALAGDIGLYGGSLLLDDQPIGHWSTGQLAQRRAVLMQSNMVSFGFSVAEVVAMGRAPWTREVDDDQRIVAEAAHRTDVAHLWDRSVMSLSGGERARVSLARVLAQQAPVVLLDEPTAALDLRHQEDVMAIARELAEAGRAVVVVLHDLSLAAAWADQIAVLDQGRLVTHGAPLDVLTAELIEQVYGLPVRIVTDTATARLLVVPQSPARSTTHKGNTHDNIR
jgi:iron complex transport system ATP-binding protein